MKMITQKTTAVTLAILAGGLLAGCKSWENGATVTNCSGGRCVTTNVVPDGGKQGGPPASSPAPSPATATPAATVSAAPSTQPPASPPPSATQTATSAPPTVDDCMTHLGGNDRDTLVSIATSDGTRQALAACLAIPPQTMALFLRLLLQDAAAAYASGAFDSQQGQARFTSGTLPADVDKCRAS